MRLSHAFTETPDAYKAAPQVEQTGQGFDKVNHCIASRDHLLWVDSVCGPAIKSIDVLADAW